MYFVKLSQNCQCHCKRRDSRKRASTDIRSLRRLPEVVDVDYTCLDYVQVSVTAVNDRPVLHFGDNPYRYRMQENRRHSFTLSTNESERSVLPKEFVLRDADSDYAGRADVQLRGAFGGGKYDSVRAIAPNGIRSVSYWINDTTMQVSFIGTASFDDYKQVCRTMYRHIQLCHQSDVSFFFRYCGLWFIS